MTAMRRCPYKLVGLGMLVALAAGCHKTQSQEASPGDQAGAAAAAAASASASASPSASASTTEDVAPPPAVVSADPSIPLNEAVVGPAPVPADYSADTAPPPPASEEQPPSPATGDVWVPGYWWWSVPLKRYAWVSGAWRDPPPEQVWTPGLWTSAPSGRFVWIPGFWGAPGTPAPVAIVAAPPAPQSEAPPPPPPGVGFVWTPGYHAYRGDRYVWVEGSYARPPREGLGWIEPRYVGVGGHYYFQPGRWDQPPTHRGVVYQPDPNVRPGVRFRPTPVAASLVVAHASFNVAAARAIAFGGTRTANGGFVFRHPAVEGHAAFGPPGGSEPHGGPPGDEPHGGPPGADERRGGPPGGDDRHGGPPGGDERHGGSPGGDERRGGGPGGNGPHGGPPGGGHGGGPQGSGPAGHGPHP